MVPEKLVARHSEPILAASVTRMVIVTVEGTLRLSHVLSESKPSPPLYVIEDRLKVPPVDVEITEPRWLADHRTEQGPTPHVGVKVHVAEWAQPEVFPKARDTSRS